LYHTGKKKTTFRLHLDVSYMTSWDETGLIHYADTIQNICKTHKSMQNTI